MPSTNPKLSTDRLLHPFNEACHLLGFSRATGYRLLKAGRIKAVKFGSKNLIATEEVRRIKAAIEDGTLRPVSDDELDDLKAGAAA